MTTRERIRGWLERGKAQGATHVVVACDTFSHEDYPVFVLPGQSVLDEEKRLRGREMTTVMEIYDLSLDLDAQLAQERCFNR